VIVALHEQTPVEEEQKILDKNNVKVDKIIQLDMDKMNVQGVPTMLLVDKQGKVLEIWNGRLPEDEQKKVLAAL
jgi:thioredoxin-related protein